MTTVKAKTVSRDGSRYYRIDGQDIPSVNTMKGRVLYNPAVSTWLRNKHIQALHDNPHLLDLDFAEAKREARRIADSDTEAIDKGNRVHEICEAFFKGETTDHPEQPWVERGLQALTVDIEPLHIEQAVARVEDGEVLWAGTADIIALVDGVVTVVDWKSGRSIYPDAALTTAGYGLATHLVVDGELAPLEKLIEQGIVAHVTEAGVSLYRMAPLNEFLPLWKALVTLYRWTDRPRAWA